jgi:hypothetical protein
VSPIRRAQAARRRWIACAVAAALGSFAACGDESDGESRSAAEAAEVAEPEALSETGAEPFTLVATGDLLIHDSVIRQAATDAGTVGYAADDYDFGTMLAGARDVVADADLALCHMETVYGADGGPYSGYPLFTTPPQIAEAVRDVGYDSCSTASNHTLDDGPDGVARTLDAMELAGLGHAGSARTEREAGEPTLLRAGDATVAQLAYTYGTNGIPVPEDQPWLVNLIDPKRIVADARAARRAGADVVVVSLHWGTEYQEAPDELQLSLAEELTASASDGRRDIDLIIGTHAHVPQAYEKVNGTWVVYGMGDQLAGVMNDPRGQMSSAARFTFAPPAAEGEPWRVERAEYIPFVVDNDPIAVVNLPRAVERDPARADHAATLKTISDAVLSRDAAEDGLVMGR